MTLRLMYVKGVDAGTVARCGCLVHTRGMLGKISTDSARAVAELNHFIDRISHSFNCRDDCLDMLIRLDNVQCSFLRTYC